MTETNTSTNTIHRSHKFRLYPNAAQEKQLSIEFGHARWIWNTCLDARISAYEWYGQNVNYIDLGKALTEVKQDPEFAWLKDATTVCGQQSLRDQDAAFKNFYAGRARYPKYKRKTNRQSVRYTLDARTNPCVPGEHLKLPKLGHLKIKWPRVPQGMPKMATVSKTPDGKYWVSMMVEETIEQWPQTGVVVGVDAGIKDIAVTDNGWKSGAPRATYRIQRELKHEQRALSRKTKGSNRRKRQVVKVARVHAQIANVRSDFMHKTTTDIVKSASVVCIEDLNVAGMVKNHCLAKAVADASMGEFRRQIEYKSKWHGREVVVVDRWFPSTKMCSGCGQKHDMPLSKRRMVCDCDFNEDRDVNAAINIRAAGVSSLSFGAENVEGDTFLQPEYAA